MKKNSALYKWFWNSVFVAILATFGTLLYLSSLSIDYTWRWNRLPQYVISEKVEQFRSATDGVFILTSDKKVAAVINDFLSDDEIATASQVLSTGKEAFYDQFPNSEIFTDFQLAILEPGAELFAGDVVAESRSTQIGPLITGLLTTIEISVVSLAIAIIIGVTAGLGRVSENPAAAKLSLLYVEVIRGTPLLVQLFIFYFFIGTVLHLDRFTAGVAALAIFTGAYIAEIIRAGIQSIDKGQMEAARSLGMSYVQAMRFIIMPQVLKRTLPSLAGQFINLIKDSSLVSVIAITDLTKAGREITASSFSPFEVWFTVAILYLVLTGGLSWLIKRLETRLSYEEG